MKLEDRDWHTLLERLELEMSDADLAAADRKLWELPDDDVVDVRPEWVEATVAKAVAEPEVVHEPVVEPVVEVAPSRRWGWWGKVQRFAAAAIAFMSLHTAATAATAVTVVTVGAVVVVLLWEGADSDRNMTYQLAVEILGSDTQPVDAKEAAMLDLANRIVIAARTIAATEPVLPIAADHARLTLEMADLREAIVTGRGQRVSLPPSLDFDSSLRRARQGSVDGLLALCEQASYALNVLSSLQDERLLEARDKALASIQLRVR